MDMSGFALVREHKGARLSCNYCYKTMKSLSSNLLIDIDIHQTMYICLSVLHHMATHNYFTSCYHNKLVLEHKVKVKSDKTINVINVADTLQGERRRDDIIIEDDGFILTLKSSWTLVDLQKSRITCYKVICQALMTCDQLTMTIKGISWLHSKWESQKFVVRIFHGHVINRQIKMTSEHIFLQVITKRKFSSGRGECKELIL